MTRSVTTRLRIILPVLFIVFSSLHGSSSLYHVPPPSVQSGEAVEIEAIVLGDAPVLEAKVFHRTTGQSGFHEIRMRFEGGIWHATIPPGFVSSAGLEYAMVFNLADGSSLAFPRENPLDSPYAISVQPEGERSRSFGEEDVAAEGQLRADVLIISPEEGRIVNPTDVLIVASLFNVQSLDPNSVELFLDNRNVTSEAVISPEIVSYSHPLAESGLHTVRIELRNTYGHTLQPVTWTFRVGGGGAEMVTAADEFEYSGRLRTQLSLDQVGESVLGIGQTTTTFRGGWPWLRFRTNVRLRTDESKFRQPRDRYSATIQSGDYITASVGDFTPVLSPYTVDGKRVRGMGIDVDLKVLRFQLVSGELERTVQGLPDVDRSYRVEDVKIDEKGLLYVIDRMGYTFARKYNAYRLSIHLPRKFTLGLNFQKAKDQLETVQRDFFQAKLSVPYDTSLALTQLDSGIYTFSEFQAATSETGLRYQIDDKRWGGNKPQDNVVMGFDAGISFDEQRLAFNTSWAISLLNKDIWDGPMTLTELDTTLDDSVDGFMGRVYDKGEITSQGFSLEKMIDPQSLEDFFVVNQYMVPLIPIDFDALSQTPIAAVMNMPSAAYRFRMRAYYYNNALEVQYSQVGPEFKSLANPYLSSNVREFDISDRLRVFDNRLLVNFEYKHRDNKILRSVVDPYFQNTLMTNLTFAPGVDLPSFTMNFQTVRRGNGKTELDTLVHFSITGRDSVSFKDQREDARTRNRLFSINMPGRYGRIAYNLLGTVSLIDVVDLMEEERAEGFSPPNTSSSSFSLVGTIKSGIPLRTSVNISGYTVQLPAAASGGKGQPESRLVNMGVDANYEIPARNLEFQGGLSLSKASGISQFAYYGFKAGVDYKPIRRLVAKLTFSTKIKQTEDRVSLGTLAVKFSANYVF